MRPRKLETISKCEETLLLLDWDALVGDALLVTEKGNGGINFHVEYLVRHVTLSIPGQSDKE